MQRVPTFIFWIFQTCLTLKCKYKMLNSRMYSKWLHLLLGCTVFLVGKRTKVKQATVRALIMLRAGTNQVTLCARGRASKLFHTTPPDCLHSTSTASLRLGNKLKLWVKCRICPKGVQWMHYSPTAVSQAFGLDRISHIKVPQRISGREQITAFPAYFLDYTDASTICTWKLFTLFVSAFLRFPGHALPVLAC